MLAAYRLDVSAGEGTRLLAEHAVGAGDAPRRGGRPGAGARRAGGRGAGVEAPPAEKPRRWGDRSATIDGVPAPRRGRRRALRVPHGRGRHGRDRGDARAPPRRLRLRRRPLHAGGRLRPRLEHGDRRASRPEGSTGRRGSASRSQRCDLGPGTYLVDVAVHARNGTPYDYWRGACRFRVDSPRTEAGIWAPGAVLGRRGRGFLGPYLTSGSRFRAEPLPVASRVLLWALLAIAVTFLVVETGHTPFFEPDEVALRRDPARDARDRRPRRAAPERVPLLREAASPLLGRRGLDVPLRRDRSGRRASR